MKDLLSGLGFSNPDQFTPGAKQKSPSLLLLAPGFYLILLDSGNTIGVLEYSKSTLPERQISVPCLTIPSREAVPSLGMSIPMVQSGKEVAILFKAHSKTPILYKHSSRKQVQSIYLSLEKCKRLEGKKKSHLRYLTSNPLGQQANWSSSSLTKGLVPLTQPLTGDPKAFYMGVDKMVRWGTKRKFWGSI